jgi:hypothetical protein
MTHPLLGCWDAVSLVIEIDGELIHPLGPDICGQLIYTSDARMSVQIVAAQRPGFASGDMRIATEVERQAAFDSSISYFGRYEIEPERQLVHHRILASAFPNWTGKLETRGYRLDADRLELRAPPERFAGREAIAVATWRRADAQ